MFQLRMETNGFFLFKDNASVNDQSGNGNNFTVANGNVTQTEDCPSNVFATWNPYQKVQITMVKIFINGNTTFVSGETQPIILHIGQL